MWWSVYTVNCAPKSTTSLVLWWLQVALFRELDNFFCRTKLHWIIYNRGGSFPSFFKGQASSCTPVTCIMGDEDFVLFSGFVWSMMVRQSALMTRALMDSKASWWSPVQEKSDLAILLVRGVKRSMWSISFGRNTAMYRMRPKKAWTSVGFVGTGQSNIFCIFDLFGSIPRAEIWCPFLSKSNHISWDYRINVIQLGIS